MIIKILEMLILIKAAKNERSPKRVLEHDNNSTAIYKKQRKVEYSMISKLNTTLALRSCLFLRVWTEKCKWYGPHFRIPKTCLLFTISDHCVKTDKFINVVLGKEIRFMCVSHTHIQ